MTLKEERLKEVEQARHEYFARQQFIALAEKAIKAQGVTDSYEIRMQIIDALLNSKYSDLDQQDIKDHKAWLRMKSKNTPQAMAGGD